MEARKYISIKAGGLHTRLKLYIVVYSQQKRERAFIKICTAKFVNYIQDTLHLKIKWNIKKVKNDG